MAGFSDYLESKALRHIFNAIPFTPPTDFYLALFTSAPNDAATAGIEVSTIGTGYARTLIGPWTTEVDGKVMNANEVLFPIPTAVWGSVVAYGIYDAVSGGNLLVLGNLTSVKNVNLGDTVKIPVAGLSVSME